MEQESYRHCPASQSWIRWDSLVAAAIHLAYAAPMKSVLEHSAKPRRIHDVAKALKVSQSSVSKAINGREGVSEELRQRIIAYCDRIGYKPNPFAQDFARMTKGADRTQIPNVAFLLADVSFSRTPYSQLLDGITSVTEKNQYTLNLAQLPATIDCFDDLPRAIVEGRVAGVLISGTVSTKLLRLLQECGIGRVLIGSYEPELSAVDACVGLDLEAAMHLAVQYCVQRGRSRIALYEPGMVTYYQKRLYSAFRLALVSHGLKDDPERNCFAPYDTARNFRPFQRRFVERGVDFDAVIVPNRYAASCTVAALLGVYGLQQEIPVTLIAGPDIAPAAQFDLACLDMRYDELGRVGMELLLQCLRDGEKAASPQTVLVKPTLRACGTK